MSDQTIIRDPGPEDCLGPTRYLDSEHPAIRAFVEETVGDATDPRERAVALYYRVRDGIRYDPYSCRPDADSLIASRVLAAGRHYCIGKAVLLAAAGRAAGIPTRLGFADVRNHLTSARLYELMGTDVFRYHGFTEMHLDGRWVKCTPAFNLGLCEKAGVKPLEWDGREDSVFHEFDNAGQRHMEYLTTRQPVSDLPVDELFSAFAHYYPKMFAALQGGAAPAGDFDAEVAAEAAAGDA
ncbi:transglutaminase [Salinisphaera sp. PC39]|uniref:transglutaminase-like domain-containing protein n=1 Tax=Salinisphaera sp. PC39 TaxID=1304156 RepID=UPI00333F6DA4